MNLIFKIGWRIAMIITNKLFREILGYSIIMGACFLAILDTTFFHRIPTNFLHIYAGFLALFFFFMHLDRRQYIDFTEDKVSKWVKKVSRGKIKYCFSILLNDLLAAYWFFALVQQILYFIFK